MPKFLEKKKRNPASRHPAQNTKGYSKGSGKTKKQVMKEEFRPGANDVEAKPRPNKADAWIEQASRPRERNKMSSDNVYGEYDES